MGNLNASSSTHPHSIASFLSPYPVLLFASTMEFDFSDTPFDTRAIKPHEIEEIFEDPFAIRLLPDNERADGETRYYLLGKTISGRGLFLAFWSNGKNSRVISARELSEEEDSYYERKIAEFK